MRASPGGRRSGGCPALRRRSPARCGVLRGKARHVTAKRLQRRPRARRGVSVALTLKRGARVILRMTARGRGSTTTATRTMTVRRREGGKLTDFSRENAPITHQSGNSIAARGRRRAQHRRLISMAPNPGLRSSRWDRRGGDRQGRLVHSAPLVLDVIAPHMGGFEVARRLRPRRGECDIFPPR